MSDKEIQKILSQLKTLKTENEKLKEENAYLKFRLDELQSKRYKPKRKPPDDTPPAPPTPPKKKRRPIRTYRLLPEKTREDR